MLPNTFARTPIAMGRSWTPAAWRPNWSVQSQLPLQAQALRFNGAPVYGNGIGNGPIGQWSGMDGGMMDMGMAMGTGITSGVGMDAGIGYGWGVPNKRFRTDRFGFGQDIGRWQQPQQLQQLQQLQQQQWWPRTRFVPRTTNGWVQPWWRRSMRQWTPPPHVTVTQARAVMMDYPTAGHYGGWPQQQQQQLIGAWTADPFTGVPTPIFTQNVPYGANGGSYWRDPIGVFNSAGEGYGDGVGFGGRWRSPQYPIDTTGPVGYGGYGAGPRPVWRRHSSPFGFGFGKQQQQLQQSQRFGWGFGPFGGQPFNALTSGSFGGGYGNGFGWTGGVRGFGAGPRPRWMSTGPYHGGGGYGYGYPPIASGYGYGGRFGYPQGVPQQMPQQQPWGGFGGYSNGNGSGWMTQSPHRRNVYPQDMAHIIPNGLSTTDVQLWKDLPATLRDIDLIDHNDRSGKHSWLLNTRFGVTWLLLMAKREQNVTFEEIANKLGLNPVWVTSAIYGQQTFDNDTAVKLIRLLGFEEEKTGKKIVAQLTCPPMRGTCPMADPTMLRFHELIALYAPTFKALIAEKLGDGVVSAVDNKIFLQVKSAFGQWTNVGAFTATADGQTIPVQQSYGVGAGAVGGYGGYGSGTGVADPAATEARAYYNGVYDTQPSIEAGQQRVRIIIEGAHVQYRPY